MSKELAVDTDVEEAQATVDKLGLVAVVENNVVHYKCNRPETYFERCQDNLASRLEWINQQSGANNSRPFDVWYEATITTREYVSLCLCGHPIKEVHNLVCTFPNGNMAKVSIGSKCIERFFAPLYVQARDNVRRMYRKTHECEKCDRTRVSKDKECGCSKLPHCLQCQKVIKTGMYCLQCEMTNSCRKCLQPFQVKSIMRWWQTICPHCRENL